MKALIIKQVGISGDHVPAGTVRDVDDATFKQLSLYGKAVELSKATDEQKKLIAALEKANADAAAKAKGAK